MSQKKTVIKKKNKIWPNFRIVNEKVLKGQYVPQEPPQCLCVFIKHFFMAKICTSPSRRKRKKEIFQFPSYDFFYVVCICSTNHHHHHQKKEKTFPQLFISCFPAYLALHIPYSWDRISKFYMKTKKKNMARSIFRFVI